MKQVWLLSLLLLLSLTSMRAYQGQAAPFPDVPAGHWAAAPVRSVAVERDWLRNYGTARFRPESPLLRSHLAGALMRAFAPGVAVNPRLTFKDLTATDDRFEAANIAVSLGWMGQTPAKEFLPDKPLTKADVATVLTRALGLKQETAGLDAIATADGVRLAHPRTFAPLALSGALQLFVNHADERRELLPSSVVTRADGAHVLWKASSAKGTWRIKALERFRSIKLPAMTPDRRAAVEFALAYTGYPYVGAGEWHRPTPSGYCCGAQPQGGFDCSGFVWWVLRAPTRSYDNTAVRKYRGWLLPERASRDMARGASPRLTLAQAKPGDLLFSDIDRSGTDWQSIDHVGIALGGGWMIHSSTPGVLIEWVGDGWWPTRFRWARTLTPAA